MRATNPHGSNVGLLVVTALVFAVAGAIVLGPGRATLEDASNRFKKQVDRFESWRGQLAGFQRPGDLESSQRGALWDELLAHARPADDASALVAQVSDDFRSAGVRDLRVHPITQAPGKELETHELHSPVDGHALSVAAVPVSVEFRAGPDDTLRILQQLDAGDLPARIEVLELRRDLPAVAVRMELEYFVRREITQ